MYIHIGNSKIIFCRDLIGIFNITPPARKSNAQLLDSASDDALYKIFGNDRPKSYVVTDNQVYMSPISPLTLSRRHNSST